MPNPIRPQPYRLKWPLTPSQVEGLDEMLQILFKAARQGSGSVAPSTSGSAGVPGPPGSDGAEGADGNPGPPGVPGVPGAQGVVGRGIPGIDGEDGVDSLIPGPRGSDGSPGAAGAQGSAGVGVPGVDGEDGADSLVPGPRGNDGGTGPPGAQGPTGLGVPGRDGEDGEVWWPSPFGAATASSAPAASSGLVLLEQHTASSSASLEFTTGITSTYDDYQFEIVNIRSPSGSVTLQFQVSSDGGGTWLSVAVYRRMGTLVSSASPTVTGVSDSSSSFLIAGTIEPSGAGATGTVRLREPLTALAHNLHFETCWQHTDTNFYHFTGHLSHGSNVIVNAVRFKMDSGNIASGTIRLYGYAK